jgi:hypothetical protein
MFSSRFNIGILKHPGYNVGGGIGEAALIGAAFGGGKALVTGEDPLQAALLGGITGGAMSGIGSVFSQGANNLSAVASGPNIDAAGNAFEPLAPNTVPDFVPPAPVATPAVVPSEGIASIGQVTGNGQTGVNLSNAPTTLGGYVEGQPITGSVNTDAVRGNPVVGRGDLAAGNYGVTSNGIAGKPDAPFVGLKQMINPEAGGTLEKGLDYAIAHPYTTAGIGGAAYGMLNPKKIEEPKKKEEKSPLAGFNRDEFTAYEAPRPNPYPQAQYTNYFDDKYAAQGGVMRSYAGGGIAALANGSLGMGGNQMYPQGLQDHTQYATPSQMPTSAEVVNSGYEMKTDPYMGTPIGMAEGGIARYAFGGSANDYGANAYGVPYFSGARNLSELSEATQSYNRGRGSMGGFGGKMGQMDVDPSVGDYKVAPIENHYQSRYQEQAPIAQYSGPQGGMAPTYSLADSLPLLAATNPSAAKGLAQGGIASYNLGGYAAGGNPRLLKGPGDGMSDNIPATIGDRQPARLADGEFVVPADVVSHLGNGSTDAGAKHLYAMMDKVRTARTGKKAQGKQINPQKYLPA